MRKSGTIRLAVYGVAVAAFVLSSGFRSAEARPQYNEQFKKKYPDNATAITEKCAVCHIGKPTEKKWNDYGTALGKAVGGKQEKDLEKISGALEKVEKEKSGTEGKTFGDLIKDGKLPGKAK
jgi:hypothetical protein